MLIQQAAVFHALDETTDVHALSVKLARSPKFSVSLCDRRMLAPAAPFVVDVLRIRVLGTQKTGSLRHGAILRGIDLEDFCQVNHEAVGRPRSRNEKGGTVAGTNSRQSTIAK